MSHAMKWLLFVDRFKHSSPKHLNGMWAWHHGCVSIPFIEQLQLRQKKFERMSWEARIVDQKSALEKK